jgi:toxin ParE1/3/4
MRSYILTSDAKEDLRRIYFYGVFKFGINEIDKFNLLCYYCEETERYFC